MKIYNTRQGILINHKEKFYNTNKDWDTFINNDNIYEDTLTLISGMEAIVNGEEIIAKDLLAPIGKQEVWASGVTYYKSREARMEESKEAGGGDFYDRVYHADRPELFFKSPSYRVNGPNDKVRIRKDSKWNVPEPELTLAITSSGKIIGYTAGNDMSSRDIEGENPLYLPQAKCYDGSTAIGPCIYITTEPLPSDTKIQVEILRAGTSVFKGDTQIDQIKRKFLDLVEYLYRETSFPYGSLLMTGTGVVPPDSFTLAQGDEIHISIDAIGTLINTVA